MKNLTRYRIIEILKLIAGSVLPIIFWVSLIFGFDAPYIAILTISSAILHEIGHGVAISLFTDKRGSFRGHSTGFRITERDMLSYPEEIAVLLAGPFINVLTFFLTLPFGDAMHGYIRIMGYVNLATGLSNLLPIEGYDGYGALCMALKARGVPDVTKRLERVSFAFSVIITFASLHLIDVFGEGYWIFGLFFFAVLSKLINFAKYDVFEE